jgi:hypothetical protein
MFVLQAAPAAPAIWPKAAIHDTVAAIAKQPAYRRDVGTTLLDRLLQWLGDLYVRAMQALGGLPHGRLVATVAAALVVVLVLARIAYAARLRAPLRESAAGGRRAGRGGSAIDPWRDAEQLAANGRFTEAAHALYRAAVTMLAARGLVRPHESKTSGDYARELRRRGSPSYTPFRRFGARYDRIIYGAGVCSAADYRALLDDARSLTPVERAA